jgi:hypothetical protein
MRRREYIIIILGGIGWPLSQQRVKIPRVGVLWHAGSAQEEAIYLSEFQRGLSELGYVEGRTITLEHRFPNEEPDRFVSMAAEGALEPKFVQQMSLEWFFRPCVEPRRLFSRYLIRSSLFPWRTPRVRHSIGLPHSLRERGNNGI